MEKLKQNLEVSFRSFFGFSLNLIAGLDKTSDNLKFAVVNMQICLELFIKLYLIKHGEVDKAYKDGQFRSFSSVLGAYMGMVKGNHRHIIIKHQQLNDILKSRNEIVHGGQLTEWDDKIVEAIINCVFFIQELHKDLFLQPLIVSHFYPHKLTHNPVWKKNAEALALKITKERNAPLYSCPVCYAHSFINLDIINEELNHEGHQCLSCFVIFEGIAAQVTDCPMCQAHAFMTDVLNDQGNQLFLGKCLNCEHDGKVRMCRGCKKLYRPGSIADEFKKFGHFFCNKRCHDKWRDVQSATS
ncbi:hypothetical protein HF329_00660 [Chitinophaga oryzae]|uniref:Uncharacterized protein n=1 Tax=Chitinophaga oryzae TaxID=2725414 RepID=A0AAE7D5C2_9BACT|nr:hypothetical protein [Chitinophaga oryzae]QJB29894.1 hypothetical protein HF329_00660 [Chitinophaga oryzae]